jgi:hypothetical protein
MEKRKIILPSKKYQGANDESLSVTLSLDRTENLLREGDRDISLDVAKLFDDERNQCKNYKIFGKMKMIFRNLYPGTTEYVPLKRNLFLLGDGEDLDFTGYMTYEEFAFLRNDLYREMTTPPIGYTPGNYTPNIWLPTGNTLHTTLTDINAPYQNWNFYLSYVYGEDNTYPMKYTLTGNTVFNFVSGDGIPFRVSEDGRYYKLTSPVEHNISEDEYVVLLGGTLQTTTPVSGRTFPISFAGDEVYNSEKYVLYILKTLFPPNTILPTVVFGKRCLDYNRPDDTTSKYYVHKHKTLTDVNGYILDKVGFETAIFEDEKKLLFQNSEGTMDYLVQQNRMESVFFDFIEPLVLTGFTNNLNYTPTEVYVSAIFRNGNGYFDYPPKVGYSFHFHNTWIDDHFDGTTSNENGISGYTWTNQGYTFNSGLPLPIGTVLTGAFVEYNKHELKERIISESFHKITIPKTLFDHGQETAINATPTNKVGLMYQPHYRIKLRELSPYVESSNTDFIYDLPENVIFDPVDNLWKWRDLYDHGYIDTDNYGTDFPFLNNNHYVYSNLNFYLRNEVYFKYKQDGIKGFKNSSGINTHNSGGKNNINC